MKEDQIVSAEKGREHLTRVLNAALALVTDTFAVPVKVSVVVSSVTDNHTIMVAGHMTVDELRAGLNAIPPEELSTALPGDFKVQ
jgi:hypothetical protein